ncbi:hypothetical protein U9R90_22450 [Streptomyces sp. E11-3]
MAPRPWEPPAEQPEQPARTPEDGRRQGIGRLGDAPPVRVPEAPEGRRTGTAVPSGDVRTERPAPHTGSATAAANSRPTGGIPPRPGVRPPLAFDQPPPYDGGPHPPYDDDTTRLRPVPARGKPRAAVAAACVVLGLGLIGGAVTGSWLTGESAAEASQSGFAAAGDSWHNEPVDTLLPPVIKGEGAGPGGADRRWTRIAVAPDSDCADALDPLLLTALEPVGCERLVRATYTDDTRSHVTTVGMLFSEADAEAMRALRARFAKERLERREDLMPRTYAERGTLAEGFGDRQRASWTVSVLTDAPVVVFAVSGFADGRTVDEPEPVADAMAENATSAPAQAGLGHEAKGLADRVERRLRKTVSAATEKPE